MGNLEELYTEADVEGQLWREFTAAWWEEFGTAETWVAELNELCERHDLMSPVRGEGEVHSQRSRLGRALRGARDRVFGDLRVLVLPQDRKRRTGYALQSLSGALPPAAPAQPEATPQQ